MTICASTNDGIDNVSIFRFDLRRNKPVQAIATSFLTFPPTFLKFDFLLRVIITQGSHKSKNIWLAQKYTSLVFVARHSYQLFAANSHN